jgi:hypothetical protein
MEAAAEEPGPTRGSLLGTSHNHNVGERAHEVEDRSQIVETYRAETKWMESEHMWDRSAESEDAAEESPSDSSQTETESESDDSDDQSDDSDDESDESDDERRYGLADWNVFEKKAVASPLTGSIKSWSQGLLVHANKRLIELIIDARKALHTSRWSALWRSIQELVKWLNRAQLRERLKSLGLLLPILCMYGFSSHWLPSSSTISQRIATFFFFRFLPSDGFFFFFFALERQLDYFKIWTIWSSASPR